MTRRGFTLIETLVSMAISSIILGAIASVFVLMARSMPDDTSPLARTNQLTRGIDRFSFDISWATGLVQATPAKVQLTVPDCTGDGIDDTVVYVWSGAGSPWTRSLNNGTPEVVCDSVGSLTFLWRYRSVATTPVIKTLEYVRVEISSTNAGARPVLANVSATSHARIP